MCVMGWTKRVCEHLALANHKPSVRFGNVLASSGSVLTIWDRQLACAVPLTVANATRYFLTVEEAADFALCATDFEDRAAVYIPQMGEPIDLTELATRYAASMGYSQPAICRHPLRFGEKAHEALYARHEHPEPTEHPLILAIKG
jgi:FlaA1/EpsC-like NDP-sugar epimerase